MNNQCPTCGAFQWISVKDRLPRHGEEVACAFDEDKDVIFLVRCNNGKWEEFHEGSWDSEWFDVLSPITHWMPPPYPPED